ncbi:MAG: glutamate synthase [Phycisphaeraceae bacterium]|nr:glutamate synthase [Phycisphaeraceae bacterium]
MAELIPYPFASLVTRMLRELDERGSCFDLPASKFYTGDGGLDFSVRFHGARASTPLGPAAGPHSQMAQNIALSWLGGSRIIELKTVQVIDTLTIPRPCIDMRTVGYNVEWSQELRLEQSLAEYVKGMMLIEILKASGKVPLAEGAGDTIYDMSVGYDLAGITSPSVGAFLDGMRDCSALVERFRAEIPDEFAWARGIDFPSRLSDTLTLSTFHGCPPDEIERIIEHLLDARRLHCVIKCNPTLLGKARVDELLRDRMGYTSINAPASAFEKDTKWDQMVGFVTRLRAKAGSMGLGLGVKFTNTLLVEHDGDFLPATEKEKYLSGHALHPISMTLVGEFRREFGAGIPVSFSAGIDRGNFPDAVALGLTPVTVCSDLLRQGGYARQAGYFEALGKRMTDAGASTIDEFIINSASAGATRPTREQAVLMNTEQYAQCVADDPRYGAEANRKPPKKIGSMLEFFNCVTCDKCVPVCPNDANFTLHMPPEAIPVEILHQRDGRWVSEPGETVVLNKKHQIANFADFCNECGNCDVFCPEDGGPYILKPRFFGSESAFDEFPTHDGFFVERRNGGARVLARFSGARFEAVLDGDRAEYSGAGFRVALDLRDTAGTIEGQADGPVDLTYLRIIVALCGALLDDSAPVNYVNA